MAGFVEGCTEYLGGSWAEDSTGGGCTALACRVTYRHPVLGLRSGSVLVTDDAHAPILGESSGVLFGLIDSVTGEWVNGDHGDEGETWGENAGVGSWAEGSPVLTVDEVVTGIASFFLRWGVVPSGAFQRGLVSWGVWDGFGFDCEDPDNIQQHECQLIGVYPSEEIAIAEADRHYEALIANNPEWQSFFVLVRSSDEWGVK